MKTKCCFEPHLVLTKATLAPGTEWAAQSGHWFFLQVTSGVAYWLHPRVTYELVPGSALLLSDRARGVVRASQLGEVRFQFFRVNPSRLTGLMTWGDQQTLERSAIQDQMAMRAFAPSSALAQQFQQLSARTGDNGLLTRLQLFELFIHSFGQQFSNDDPDPNRTNDAKRRLIALLNHTPASELLELSFAELARQARCTPRHLSRIFHELVGMSFREKQSQLRLIRAQELLATTQSKVVEVALESGYQSLSLFNLMFKRRFGLTPAKWRDQKVPRRASGRSDRLKILAIKTAN